MMQNGVLDPYAYGSLIGSWHFVPDKAAKKVAADLQLLFP